MDTILVMDFGGQYSRLVARRVREHHVYAVILPYQKVTAQSILEEGYKGIIFTGGPNSVNEENAPACEREILQTGVPILGLCYGAQLLAKTEGGTVVSEEESGEYGSTELHVSDDVLFEGVPAESVCWMSHRDRISVLPEGYLAVASTSRCPVAAMKDRTGTRYGVQFHPEVSHTEYGMKILGNFLFGICNCARDWEMKSFTERTVERYKKELAGKKVLLGLSGGVDSAVAAALLQRAVGDRLTCVFVDHGLLRKGETELVERAFRDRLGKGLVRVDASERFLNGLKGVTDPERKRKVIGELFIRVFEEEAEKLGHADVLAQGTIYPDVIESGLGNAAVIKSHHNVGGLPEIMRFSQIAEPLRDLFKDEVREVGRELGLPEELIYRQPFPGPGLAVRVLGEVTEEKLAVLREADAIFREEVDRLERAQRPSQYFAVFTGAESVGVKGDERVYGHCIALRAVSTDDFMTAQWTRLPAEVLERAGSRIANEIPDVARVVYDITSKPPATVEWE